MRGNTQTGVPKKHQAMVQQRMEQEKARHDAQTSPSARGVLFRQLPLLCWRDNGFASLADAELFEEFSNFNLLNEAIELPYFAVNEQAKSWALDMERGRLSSSFVSATQMNLNGIQSANTEQDLIGWLDSQLRQPNVFQRDMQAYLTKMLVYLTHTRKITLTALIRG